MISSSIHPLDYLWNPTSEGEIIGEKIGYKLEVNRISMHHRRYLSLDDLILTLTVEGDVWRRELHHLTFYCGTLADFNSNLKWTET